jgi:hypothetical protein
MEEQPEGEERQGADTTPEVLFKTPLSQRFSQGVRFATSFVTVYLSVLLVVFGSYLINQEVYPGLIPGPPFVQVVMVLSAWVVAPVIAFLLSRSFLCWHLALKGDGVQVGVPVFGRRINFSDVLLVRVGLLEPHSTGDLPVYLELPGLLGRSCRVWLSRADARKCFKALLEACPRAIGIDEWGAERVPTEGYRSADALKRLGQMGVSRGLAGIASCMGLALLFCAPGIALGLMAASGRTVASETWALLGFYAVPGVLCLLGLAPSVRLLRQGRARLRDAEGWATDPVPELSQ